jgi:NADPH:quinone reductase-like Zn-dependent oxidoreductase
MVFEVSFGEIVAFRCQSDLPPAILTPSPLSRYDLPMLFSIISSDWSLRNGKELANGASSLWNVFANFVRNWIRPGSTPRVAIVGVASNGPQLQSVLDWVGKRTIRPVVDRVFPLDDAHAAFRYLEQGRATGKVVIKVDHMDKKAEG